eukprot:Clim_evm67s109 gene=Clim_evmTU67s109
MEIAKMIRGAERGIALIAVLMLLRKISKEGAKKAILGPLLRFLRTSVPGVGGALDAELDKEASKAVKDLFKHGVEGEEAKAITTIPKNGRDHRELYEAMRRMKQADVDGHAGKAWAYVYAQDHSFSDNMTKAATLYLHDNALNPIAFPSLRKMEVDVVNMTADMLNGDEDVRGNVTSGGTESLLLAVKTYRDYYGHKKGITEPELVMPITAHAAFTKASHYFGVKINTVDVGPDMKPKLSDIERLINRNTVLIVGSAPQYPHGVVDPIVGMSELAQKYDVGLHVDACIGGFMLPWVEAAGYPVPQWDFRVPGVTSISADVHKYGYACKGASVLVWRNESLRKYQFFAYGSWPGGLFASPTMLGTRGGGPLAGAWFALNAMGQDGYTESTRKIMETRGKIEKAIHDMGDLKVLGNPEGTLLSFTTTNPDQMSIYAVADVLEDKYGWHMERQQKPDCLHLTIMPPHIETHKQFLKDLHATVDILKSPEGKELNSKGTAAMYGMITSIPDDTVVYDFIVNFLGKVYAAE